MENMKILDKSCCDWAQTPPIMRHYHDTEWGVPLYDDRKIFEFIVLDGMQAGLSWLTVLKKRENFREAFDNFNPEKVARYGTAKTRKLLANSGIIRNRLKIKASIANARVFLEVAEKRGEFYRYIWDFVDGKPVRNRWKTMKQIPCRTTLSDKMSKSLQKNGFRFVGSTICYSFVQAAGLVNDHLIGCFRYRQVSDKARLL